jgi:uncharacterized sulfatase
MNCRTVGLCFLWLFLPTFEIGWAKQPNIVLIVSDDQMWSDYGFMGHPLVQSPNLDKLAAESLCFRRGYVTSSLCSPSLASIITGLYPHEHGITSNDPPIPNGMMPKAFNGSQAFLDGRESMNQMMDKLPTIPRWLSEQGYLCLQTGKWWQGNFERGGFTHGMTKGGRHGDEGLDIGRKTMQPIYDHIALAERENKPFFVWYAPMMPHTPHNPPDRLLKKYADTVDSIHEARYLAMIEWFDETIGQLLTHLDEKKLSEETLVMYIADNGWITDPKNGSYASRSKQSQYDGGLRTPILLRWKGKIEPNNFDSLAQSIDFFPTIIQAVSPDKTPEFARKLGGINLLDSQATADRQTIYGACFTHNSIDLNDPRKSLRFRWMIDESMKLIVPDQANESKQPVELYDLSKDAYEKSNLYAAQGSIARELETKLNAWWNP